MIESVISWFQSSIVDSWSLVLAFFITQLVNVFLSTIKTVLTVRGTQLTATIINTVSYTINAAVISQVGKVNDTILVCIITAVTNLIGVYFSLSILERFRKETLWKIDATIAVEDIKDVKQSLHDEDIPFITLVSDWDKRVPMFVYASNRSVSKKVQKIFSKYDVKYTISSSTKEL